MKTNQLLQANAGRITEEMEQIAKAEQISPEIIMQRVAGGQIVILKGRFNGQKVVGVGKGLRTKVNASIGTSTDYCNIEHEKKKAIVSEKNGADTLMELMNILTGSVIFSKNTGPC